MKQLLTTAQVADILQVEEQTLIQWRSRRTVLIPYIKLGSSVRYHPDDLEKWINDQKTTNGESQGSKKEGNQRKAKEKGQDKG